MATTTKTKVDPAAAHLAKLKSSVDKRVKYNARTHTGQGTIGKVYEGLRGHWVVVKTKDNGDVTVRPSQVKFY